MNIHKITNNFLKNRYLLKGLEKISQHGTSFCATSSLILSTTLKPLAIYKTPDTENENKKYAMSSSICSGLIKYAIIESVAIPIENAVLKIDKNPNKFLNSNTINKFASNQKAYKLLTQVIKLSSSLLTAIPKSMLTVALIPVVMDNILQVNKKNNNKNIRNNYISQPTFFVGDKNINFTGYINDKLVKNISKIIDNTKIQNLAIKYQNNDKNIAKHITAGNDLLLTSSNAFCVYNSKNIRENRKNALIYNNILSTIFTLGIGYLIDLIFKNKSQNFIKKFKQINSADKNVHKYIEGINILRPAIIFAAVYYCLLPVFSTYMSEKIDKFIIKHKD